ncbi:MAG: hypothetical protein K5771_02685 [Oscillospiraceae bacterium]|nr:hypothetical protein [Oscillospiraceae bacterium]
MDYTIFFYDWKCLNLKKVLIIIFLVSIMSELCACGAKMPSPPTQIQQEPVVQEVEKTPEKYEKLISLIEAEDYDGAIAEINGMRPPVKVPETVEVEINMDNFLDYFEYVEYNDLENSTRDENGNISWLISYCRYAVKDGIILDFTKNNSVTIEINVESSYYTDPQNVDIENMVFEPGDGVLNNTQEITATGIIEEYGKITEGIGAEIHNYEITFATQTYSSLAVNKLTSYELLSASGILYLLKDN